MSLHRALDVLHAVGRSATSVGVSELARATRLPKSTVHRLVHALCDRGLVEKDERATFRIGFGLIALGLRSAEHDPIVSAARPALKDLATSLNETVFLVVARAGGLWVADKFEGDGVMRVAPTVGGRVPVHATAAGRLYLAFDPDAVSLGPLERFTPRTPTTRAALDRAVRRAARRQWDSNDGEWIEGLGVVSAPIRDTDRLHGVLAMAAPSERLRSLGVEVVAGDLAVAAQRITRRMRGEAA